MVGGEGRALFDECDAIVALAYLGALHGPHAFSIRRPVAQWAGVLRKHGVWMVSELETVAFVTLHGNPRGIPLWMHWQLHGQWTGRLAACP